MIGVKLPFKISNCEDAAYNLASEMISKGYSADVKCTNGIFSTIIHRHLLIHNFIGNPVVIVVSFFPLEDGTGIETREGLVDVCVESVVKAIVSYALLVPGLVKRINAVKMERKIMRKALIVAKKLNVEQKEQKEITDKA